MIPAFAKMSSDAEKVVRIVFVSVPSLMVSSRAFDTSIVSSGFASSSSLWLTLSFDVISTPAFSRTVLTSVWRGALTD